MLEQPFGALERLHSGLCVVVDEQNGAFGERVGGDGFSEGERDVVRGKHDVGGADEDVINVKIGRGAVEVERYAGGGIVTVAVAAPKRAIFDNGYEGYEDIIGYCRSELKSCQYS